MLRVSKISFPGLGIGEFSIDSVAFSIGGTEIAWYALIITLGMILASIHIVFRAKQVGISADTMIDYIIITIPCGVIGARIYYVAFSDHEFSSFLDVINIRNGGIAIYGALIAGAITVYIITRVKKIPFLTIADTVTPGILLAQGIGRWGNFANGEAFGGVTDIFCRMSLNNSLTGYATTAVHPTFLYESLWNVLGFVIANLFHKKRQFDGQVFLFIFGWYGFGRMFIEGLRTDSLYASIFGLEFRVSQILAGIIFVTCAVLMTLMEYKFVKNGKEIKLYYHTESKKTKKEK